MIRGMIEIVTLMVIGAVVAVEAQLAGTVFVAGDSTAAPSGTGNGTQGLLLFSCLSAFISTPDLSPLFRVSSLVLLVLCCFHCTSVLWWCFF